MKNGVDMEMLKEELNMDYKDEKYYNLMMFSAVLGSGAHSKLFLNVREKHSLCYSIYSSLEKLKGLKFVS